MRSFLIINYGDRKKTDVWFLPQSYWTTCLGIWAAVLDKLPRWFHVQLDLRCDGSSAPLIYYLFISNRYLGFAESLYFHSKIAQNPGHSFWSQGEIHPNPGKNLLAPQLFLHNVGSFWLWRKKRRAGNSCEMWLRNHGNSSHININQKKKITHKPSIHPNKSNYFHFRPWVFLFA